MTMTMSPEADELMTWEMVEARRTAREEARRGRRVRVIALGLTSCEFCQGTTDTVDRDGVAVDDEIRCVCDAQRSRLEARIQSLRQRHGRYSPPASA